MNIGYLGGLTAVVPTEDFWRRKNFDLQLEQNKQRQEAINLEKQNQLQKAININPSKVHKTVQADYEKGLSERAQKIQQLAIGAKGQMTKELQDAVMEVQMFNKKFESLSDRLKTWESIPDNTLTPEGLEVKRSISRGLPIPEIEKNYKSKYNNRLMPLLSDGQGSIDQSVFIIQKPDYMKEIYADAKGTDVMIEGAPITVAGKRGQEIIQTSFKTKEDAKAYMKKTGKTGVLSAEDIALSKFGDELVFESALKANSGEFLQEYDAIYNSFTPEQKAVVDNRPEIKDKLSKEILAKVVARKVTPEIKTSIVFGYAPKQGGSGSGGNKSETDIYNTINNNWQPAIQSTQAVFEKKDITPTKKAVDMTAEYGKTLGVGSGNWAKVDDSKQIVYVLPLNPQATTKFNSYKIPSAKITSMEIDGKVVPINYPFLKDKYDLNDNEVEALESYIKSGVKGDLQSEFIYPQVGGKSLFWGDVKKSVAKGVNPFEGAKPILVQKFTLVADNNEDLQKAINSLKGLKFVTEYDASKENLNAFNPLRSDKANVVRGKQEEAIMPTPETDLAPLEFE